MNKTNQLLTDAIKNGVKKPTKARMFEMLSKMVDTINLGVQEPSSRVRNDLTLQALLLFHTPPAPRAPKSPMQWVALGVSKLEERGSMKLVHVIDGVAYASCGRRLHTVDVSLEDGTYCPKTLKRVETDHIAPNFKQTIPSSFLGSRTVTLGDFEARGTERLALGDYIFDVRHIRDCFSMFDEMTFRFNDINSPVQFSCDGCVSVIMPRKKEDK